MIKFVRGNILESDARVLVNPVNCVGVSGKGLAFAFKQTYRSVYLGYKEFCDTRGLRPGGNFVMETDDQRHSIYHFPTKRHWRDSSELADIESGLVTLAVYIVTKRITSIAIPALGCGLGGLSWNVVKALIVKALDELPCDIEVYEPSIY